MDILIKNTENDLGYIVYLYATYSQFLTLKVYFLF